MNRFDELVYKLKKDDEVPEKVWAKLDKALDNLLDHHEKAHGWNWRKGVSAAVVMLAVVTTVGCGTALAAGIPFIGRIFEAIEQNVSFSGDYSGKAETLGATAADGSGSADGITVSDSGVSVTASEVYCDGLSVFLTAEVSADKGGLKNIPSYYTASDGSRTSEMLYLRGEWKLAGDSETQTLMNNNLEGKVLDDHTFAGMVKLDLDGRELEQGSLELRLTGIGWDDTTIPITHDIAESVLINGEWKLDIPFNVDKETAREIEVNKERNGYTIQKVFASPYQVVVYTGAPVRKIQKDISREGYEEKLGLEAGEEATDISYQEYTTMLESQSTPEPYTTVVCNQDGEILPMGDSSLSSGVSTFAVDGKDISGLHIYIFAADEDYENVFTSDGKLNMNVSAEKAVVSAKVKI